MPLPDPTLQLGAFEVFETIGTGGMGTVRHGRHRTTGVPVAVKFLAPASAWGRAAKRMFRTEVRAVASLDHPGIVLVLDHGEVPDGTADVAAGTPYLVMELCSGGTLGRHRGVLGWPRIRPLLLSLLSALGHAHARGVVHRDIKPANVLVGTPLDLRPGVKLSDFGIAQVRDREAGGSGSDVGPFRAGYFAGSPPYAPPEQLLGREADIGPWSDLYAVGCLAWALMCGDPPHARRDYRALAAARVRGRLPPFEPLDPTPPEFVDWLLQMMAARPTQRFQCAADAAWALRKCAPRTEEERAGSFAADPTGRWPTATGVSTDPDSLGTERGSAALAPTRLGTVAITLGPEDLPDVELEPEAARRKGVRAPLPDDWRPARTDPPAARLAGAGLGLFAFRAVSMVGREEERDRIWSALHDVVRTSMGECLVLRGSSGVGKSRLAQWMCERADELGVATIGRARHHPERAGDDGVGPMIRGLLRVPREPLDLRAYVGRALRAWGVESDRLEAAAMELIEPGSSSADGGPHRALETEGDRWEALAAIVSAAAADRPVLLHFDDVQWGPQSLAVILRLLRGRRIDRAPVLVLATVRDEALAAGTAEAALLDAVLESPGCRELKLGPLGPEEHAALVGGLLGLEDDLHAEVVRRTDGNPLFAVQLLGDWVRRGVLEVGRDGFSRAAGAGASIPDDIHALWVGRFDDVLAGGSASWDRVLDTAAALGMTLDPRDWTEASAVDVEAADGPMVRLLAARLIEADGERVRFVHAMARESLQRRAVEAGRWEEAHLACARALASQHTADAIERRGLHRLQAGDPEGASLDLRTAASHRIERGDVGAAQDLLASLLEALDRADVPGLDPRRLEARLDLSELSRRSGRPISDGDLRLLLDDVRARDLPSLESRTLCELGRRLRDAGRLGEAQGFTRRALDVAEGAGDSAAVGAASTSLAWIRLLQNETKAAITLFERGADVHRRRGDLGGVATACMGLSDAHLRRRDYDVARAFGTRALEAAEERGDLRRVGDACMHLARVEVAEGVRLEVAEELLTRAREAQTQTDGRLVLASTLNLLGEVARKRGRFDVAAQWYRECLEIHEAYGPAYAWLPRLNLAVLAMDAGRFADAREPIEAARRQLADVSNRGLVQVADILLLPALLGDEDYASFDACLARVEAAAPGWARVDKECLAALRWAGPMAERAGHRDAVERLRRLEQQYAGRLESPS